MGERCAKCGSGPFWHEVDGPGSADHSFVSPSEQGRERVQGHGNTCGCMFCIEYRRAVKRNAEIPQHARMVVTNPVLSAHRRTTATVKREEAGADG